MIFYQNWRSLAAYRVRVALAMKAIPHEVVDINLAAGAQHDPAFRAINPQAVLPVLVIGATDGAGNGGRPAAGADTVLFQSLAILEYLEEIRPMPALLPSDPAGRARVRGLAQIHAADVHPLLVPRVRQYLQKDAGFDDAALERWLFRALRTGLAAIEANLAASPSTGTYCHGEQPTLADICLCSQLIAMQLFKCDASAYPIAQRIFATCQTQPAFADAHPMRQPGAPVG